MNEIGEACPSITTPIAIVSEDGKEGWGRWMRIADYERYLARRGKRMLTETMRGRHPSPEQIRVAIGSVP